MEKSRLREATPPEALTAPGVLGPGRVDPSAGSAGLGSSKGYLRVRSRLNLGLMKPFKVPTHVHLRMVRRVTQLDPHLDDGVSLDHEPVLCGPCREASQVADGPHSGWQLHS